MIIVDGTVTRELNEAEAKAFELAFMDGGRLMSRGETRAFQAGHREGWWCQERGINNADCVHIFAERHWRDYMITSDIPASDRNCCAAAPE